MSVMDVQLIMHKLGIMANVVRMVRIKTVVSRERLNIAITRRYWHGPGGTIGGAPGFKYDHLTIESSINFCLLCVGRGTPAPEMLDRRFSSAIGEG